MARAKRPISIIRCHAGLSSFSTTGKILGAANEINAGPPARPHRSHFCIRSYNGGYSRSEEAESGAAYDLCSGAAHVFNRAHVRVKLISDIFELRIILGFKLSAATDAFSDKVNALVREENSETAFAFWKVLRNRHGVASSRP